jgi:hypothetical protein
MIAELLSNGTGIAIVAVLIAFFAFRSCVRAAYPSRPKPVYRGRR